MQFLMNPATDKENNMGYLERIDAYKDEMLEALAEFFQYFKSGGVKING